MPSRSWSLFLARNLIEGPVPLFAYDAPTAGTGKGLLAATTGLILSGSKPPMMSETRDEEELRKRITALLSAGPDVVVLDNVKRRLDTGTFAAPLTSTSWRDGILGRSETVELPNRAAWLVTGNNLQMSDEITRRTVWIRIDSRRDRPWERMSFRHPELESWVLRHRSELLWAFLVLIQRWIAAGLPAWTGRLLGSFEAWSKVVGGVLEAAGINGFLANRDELYRRLDGESEEWRSFTRAWFEAFAEEPVKTADLLVIGQEFLPSLFERAKESSTDRALKTRLGKALGERRDRRFADLFIRHVGEDGHAKGALWRIEVVEDAEGDAPTPAPSADVPREEDPSSDSFAELAELADMHSGSAREDLDPYEDLDMWAAAEKGHPHVPQPGFLDSELVHSGAEGLRKIPRQSADVPRCTKCRRVMSPVRVSDVCGICAL